MRILLFHPRGRAWRPDSRDAGHASAVLPPLGLASIAAALRAERHEVAIHDAALDIAVPNEEWVRRIVAYQPDLLGISAITPAFNDAYDICRRVKDALPRVTTVFGGVHVSWGRERILERFGAVDVVVAGEGEAAMRQLAGGDPQAQIPGVISRDGPRMVAARARGREDLADMDDLPFPAYDLLPGFPRRYSLPLFSYRRPPGAHIISSRGCLYRCSYCDRSVYGRTFRWSSPEYTFDLVKHLARSYGVRHVIFYDDLFTLQRERVARLCELLCNARLGVRFNCIVRVGHIDDDLTRLLKRAGCWMVNVGIESGDQRILDRHKEGLTLERIRGDIERLHRAGLYVKGLFMLGFPGETVESMRATIDLAASLPLKDANVTAFTPYPGSPIADGIEGLGALDNDWDKMDCVNVVFVPNEIGSRQAIEQACAEFVRRFYRRPFARRMYRAMLLESPHSYWRLLKDLPTFLAYTRKLDERGRVP